MPSPLISILTPFKNTSPYLADCLDSILNQTYQHWELIIVDDHSTDNSYEIVNTYSKKEPRIKLFKTNGEGIIEALRLAFSKSNGELITRMDSDDIMLPNRLEILANSLTNHGLGHVAIGQVQYFSHEGISDGYARYEKWLNTLTRSGSNYSEIYKECVIPSPCWMVYRDDLMACEAFQPNNYPEDYDLTFRFYRAGLTCIPCKSILHLWRDYSTRTSRTHEHYAQNYFLNIKLRYFLELDHKKERPLVIWGAGYKGKTIAQQLITQGVPFYWLCDNPKKIGKQIYDQPLLSFDHLKDLDLPQSIVTVANETEQLKIRTYFDSLNMLPMNDYFFFC
ncbi:MAG: glycosyltransferase [Bacteroidota bacterium]